MPADGRNFPWSDNWWRFPSLTDKIRSWFLGPFLQGGTATRSRRSPKSLKVIVCAAPQTLPHIARVLCDWKAQFDAGWPVRLKPIGFFTEEIWTVAGAERANALGRLHQFLQPYENVRDGVWDPNAPEVQRLKDEMDTTMRELRDAYPHLALPEVSTLDPNSEEARCLIEEVWAKDRIADGRKPFDMLLSGPHRAFIGRYLRLMAGEISFPGDRRTRGGLRKSELRPVVLSSKEYFTNGFSFGFHPVGFEDDGPGFAQFQGKDAFRHIIDMRLNTARVALMGLGGETMDDPRLHEFSGPATSLGIEYPKGNRTNEEKHNECRIATTQWYPSQVRTLLIGDGTPRHHHAGHSVARRICVLHEAYSQYGAEFRKHAGDRFYRG